MITLCGYAMPLPTPDTHIGKVVLKLAAMPLVGDQTAALLCAGGALQLRPDDGALKCRRCITDIFGNTHSGKIRLLSSMPPSGL